MITRHNDISVKKLNTFGIDVRAAAMVSFDSADDLMAIASDSSLPRPIIPIGGGSNMLFTGDFGGTLLHNSIRRITPVSTPTAYGLQLVKAGGGVRLDFLCEWAAGHNLWGLENLSGIPGEVSGATVQNVGAYGAEFGNSVHAVRLFDLESGQFISIPGVECEFSYRHSIFKEPDLRHRLIVVEVTLALSREPKPLLSYRNLASHFRENVTPTAMLVREAVTTIRDAKLPRPEQTGSAGSFFKNPVIDKATCDRLKESMPDMPAYPQDDGQVKISAAWLIDRCGLKGLHVGGAAIWEHQPLVIVNADGSATPADVLTLEHKVIDAVADRFGITLIPEVEHIPASDTAK